MQQEVLLLYIKLFHVMTILLSFNFCDVTLRTTLDLLPASGATDC